VEGRWIEDLERISARSIPLTGSIRFHGCHRSSGRPYCEYQDHCLALSPADLRRLKNNFRIRPWLRINPAAGCIQQLQFKESFSAHHFGPEIPMVLIFRGVHPNCPPQLQTHFYPLRIVKSAGPVVPRLTLPGNIF
jgi:hypothetical protein